MHFIYQLLTKFSSYPKTSHFEPMDISANRNTGSEGNGVFLNKRFARKRCMSGCLRTINVSNTYRNRTSSKWRFMYTVFYSTCRINVNKILACVFTIPNTQYTYMYVQAKLGNNEFY